MPPARSLALVALAAFAAFAEAQPGCTIKDDAGNTYDFSPLTKTDGTSYDVVSDQYNYTFNICAPLPADNACSGLSGVANASMCQSEIAKPVAVISRWDSSVKLGVDSSGAPEVSSANGDNCFPSEAPRTLEIGFVCSPNRRVGDISLVNTGCTYIVQFETSLACGSDPVEVPCGLTSNGATYDLSPLKGKVLNVTLDQYAYTLSVCSNLAGGNTWAVQDEASGGNRVAGLGWWTDAGSGTPEWSLDFYGNPVVSTSNGDSCYPSEKPRTAAVEFVCSPSVPVGELTVVSQVGCVYHFSVPTQYACGRN